MLIFWFFIVLFTLITLVLISIPLLYTSKKNFPDLLQQEVAAYRDQKNILEQKKVQGELTPARYKAELTELDHELLLASDHQRTLSFKSSPGLILGLGLFIPLTALSVYLYLGSSQELSQQYQQKKQAAQVKKEIAQFGSIQNIITSLKQKLKKNPSSAEGWYLLGKLYLSQQQLSEATSAFAKANKLQPKDVNIMENYAESLFELNRHHLDSQSRQLLTEVIQLSPNNPDALNLLAWDAYQEQQYQKAIQYWRKLLTLLQPNSESVAIVKAMIQKVLLLSKPS